MAEIKIQKKYDLEDRTLNFAQRIQWYVMKLPKTIPNAEYGRQLVRSSGSVGVNYIEANESLGKKDFAMRIKICRKEAKESRFWLCLTEPDGNERIERGKLIQEATEFVKIFNAIVQKTN